MSRVGKRHIKPDLSTADCGVGGQIRCWAGGGAWDGDLGSVAEALSPCTGLAEPPGALLPPISLAAEKELSWGFRVVGKRAEGAWELKARPCRETPVHPRVVRCGGAAESQSPTGSGLFTTFYFYF